MATLKMTDISVEDACPVCEQPLYDHGSEYWPRNYTPPQIREERVFEPIGVLGEIARFEKEAQK